MCGTGGHIYTGGRYQQQRSLRAPRGERWALPRPGQPAGGNWARPTSPSAAPMQMSGFAKHGSLLHRSEPTQQQASDRPDTLAPLVEATLSLKSSRTLALELPLPPWISNTVMLPPLYQDSWQQLHALSPSSSFKGDWLVLPPPPSESHLRDAAVLEATGAAAAAAAEVAAAAAASPLSKKYPSRADSMRIVAKAFADVAKAYADAGTADDSADTADTNHTTNGANIRMLGTGPRLLYPDPQPPSLALPNEPPVPGL
ncbi:hypothetical protein VOLCADRAFT_108635 [Volvox carteri f. nagariensis]|uniref:Uncharacterized protein n=1 Tax=Volvox carteri f. nagariensis TaxID=3068 RepID=D8ULG8_VOLCA|nr:uncharacterized protein VOLCADRAFT_108635 [Volvox carteri f. nagariensis]EFJ39432.1 hypothetical protein VOLCADRAFT_108635 [Volvox carteri f. nagariensis]|eukprot:XP_002959505.1 hypothetical protein VOLCADRAFT_108635 [Volvox carteri f. nagariensis]